LGFFNLWGLLWTELGLYTHVAVCGTQVHTMATSGSDRTGGISRNSALRRRWHPETRVIGEALPQEETYPCPGKGEEEVQRPPQKALGLQVKFLDPRKID